jgi:hypothetical protein
MGVSKKGSACGDNHCEGVGPPRNHGCEISEEPCQTDPSSPRSQVCSGMSQMERGSETFSPFHRFFILASLFDHERTQMKDLPGEIAGAVSRCDFDILVVRQNQPSERREGLNVRFRPLTQMWVR